MGARWLAVSGGEGGRRSGREFGRFLSSHLLAPFNRPLFDELACVLEHLWRNVRQGRDEGLRPFPHARALGFSGGPRGGGLSAKGHADVGMGGREAVGVHPDVVGEGVLDEVFVLVLVSVTVVEEEGGGERGRERGEGGALAATARDAVRRANDSLSDVDQVVVLARHVGQWVVVEDHPVVVSREVRDACARARRGRGVSASLLLPPNVRWLARERAPLRKRAGVRGLVIDSEDGVEWELCVQARTGASVAAPVLCVGGGRRAAMSARQCRRASTNETARLSPSLGARSSSAAPSPTRT